MLPAQNNFHNPKINMNLSILRFWQNLKKKGESFHPFKKNKNFVFFGEALLLASHDTIKCRMKQTKSINSSMVNQAALSACFSSIVKIEKSHTQYLSELAIDIVSEIYGIQKDLLQADLDDEDIEVNETEEKFKDEDFDYGDLSQEIKDEINKRVLLNSFIQGASIYGFYTMHHLVGYKLEKLNKSLVSMYDDFSVGSVDTYYKVDYSEFLENLSLSKMAVLGSSEVEYDGDKPKVKAHAKIFPVLIQELVKGTMELISLHALRDIDAEDLNKIYYFADRRVDEPRYIQIGTELWKRFLCFRLYYSENVEPVSVPDLFLKIVLLSPKDVENFVEKMLENDDKDASDFLDKASLL